MPDGKEETKREIFVRMSPARQQRILRKGYDQWDPFVEPKKPPLSESGNAGRGEGTAAPVGVPRAADMDPTCLWNPRESLEEVRSVLVRSNLLDAREELVPAMLEELVHYAYFTCCLTRGDVQRLLGLTADLARQKMRQWKKWSDGNRNCSMRGNPFYQEWAAEGLQGRGPKPGDLP